MKAGVRLGVCLMLVGGIAASCGDAAPSKVPVPNMSGPVATPASTDPADIPPMGDVPFARADMQGHLIEPGPGPTGPPALAWHRDDIGESHFLPILAGGLVILGSSEGGFVTALDAHTGAERWRAPLKTGERPMDLQGAAGVANGTVFVGDSSTIYALDLASGKERWSTTVTSSRARPSVADGVVYVGTSDGVVGLDERSGRPVWTWRGPDGGASAFSPVADGVLYAAAADGKLYAIRVSDASTLWSHQTISETVGTAEIVGNTVFVGTQQAAATEPVGALYALDRATGDEHWVFQSPERKQVTAGPFRDGIMYVGTAGDGLFALRDKGSSYEIAQHVPAPETFFPLSMAGDVLFEQRRDGSVGAYAVDDLRLLWETDPIDDNGSGPPIVSGGFVIVGHLDKGVTAYADPALISALDLSGPAAAGPSPTVEPLANPFSVDRTFAWDTIGVEIPLGVSVGPDGLIYVLSTKPEVVVIDPDDGHVVQRWGHQGSAAGEFDLRRIDDNPGFGDLDVGPDGRVYVADGSNHRVQVFSATGDYLQSIGSFGTGEGQFQTPAEITVGRDGRVYVREESGPISSFTADGKFVAWVENTDGARDLAVRPDGSIVATCERCHQLLDLSRDDAHIEARHDAPLMDGDTIGPASADADGNVSIEFYGTETIIVFDHDGAAIGGMRLPPGAHGASIGRVADYGDWYWPAPLSLPDGRAFTFGRDGLVEMKVAIGAPR